MSLRFMDGRNAAPSRRKGVDSSAVNAFDILDDNAHGNSPAHLDATSLPEGLQNANSKAF
jgi:hypothetical protein